MANGQDGVLQSRRTWVLPSDRAWRVLYKCVPHFRGTSGWRVYSLQQIATCSVNNCNMHWPCGLLGLKMTMLFFFQKYFT